LLRQVRRPNGDSPKTGSATSVDGTAGRRPQAGRPGDLGRQVDRTADTARASGPPAHRRRPDPSHGEADATTSVVEPTGPWQRRGRPGHLGDSGGRQPTRRGRPDHLGGQADRTVGTASPERPPRWTDGTDWTGGEFNPEPSGTGMDRPRGR